MKDWLRLPSWVGIATVSVALCGGAACTSSASNPHDGFGGEDSVQSGGDASRAGDDGASQAGDRDASGTGEEGGGGPDASFGPEAGSGGDAARGGMGADASGAGSRDGAGNGEAATGSDGARGGVAYPAFAAAAGTINDGLTQLNMYRALVGLTPVTLDAASSTGCAAHLQYLICAAAAGGGNGYLEHTETGYPQCTGDGGGATAGIDSDLAWGQAFSNRQTVGQSFGQAVDDWMNGLYHRTPLLDPGLTKIGAASTQGYNCLDYAASGNTVTARAATPVLFPPVGTTDVPDTFSGNEGPCPTATNPQSATSCPGGGFIVSANFYGWGSRGASAINGVSSATLTDTVTGAAVPLFAWYADTVAGHDPAPGYVRNEIALVPQASLAAGHTFAVSIQATVSNQAMSLSWSFTTGSRAP